jgi:hypothetical protein
MKIFVAQFYIEVGIKYPFSHLFQRRISADLTRRVEPSTTFVQKFGDDINLIFRMSAKAGLAEPEIRGPAVFKKYNNVEYTIFLTFDKCETPGATMYRRVLKQLLQQIIIVLEGLGVDVTLLAHSLDEIIEGIVADPEMIDLDDIT